MNRRRITIDDLAVQPALGGGDLLGQGSGAIDPTTIVDLDVPVRRREVFTRAVDRAGASDVILIGVSNRPVTAELHPLLTALDVTYAPGGDHRAVVDTGDAEGAAERFRSAANACPTASLVAAQVVRAGEPLDRMSALDVESLAYSALQGGAEYGSWLAERRALGRPRPAAAPDAVLVERVEDTLHVTLNRPERRNAYGAGVRDALVQALGVAIVDDSVRRVVLDGAGPSFCAGGDLDEFGHMPDAASAHLIRTRGGAGRLVAALSARVEARLHGHCVGAGIEIPAFAGRVVARPDVRLRLPEVSMGLIPGAGGTVSVPRRIGRWRALHLFVTGAEIDATQALAWGLLDAIED
ncbi:enoyl-CoA hydratase/isomerase family protein [Gordonia sp. NPDC127522]|uniref:enoyl-CoA hydratase/isomerase family protein n=1 Tax=Gordonia sp. NPDC127522 TaxID=3345390 RepID=UPI003628A21C